MKKEIILNTLKMYNEEEREQAILKWEYQDNDMESEYFKGGDEVTVIGEYILVIEGKERKQLLFTSGYKITSLYHGHLAIIPKEKLEVGDYMTIDWCCLARQSYRVTHNEFFYLDNLNGGSAYSSRRAKSEKELLRIIQADANGELIEGYEIMPKGEHKLSVTKK